MAIGQRIKFFRKRKGITQKQLGETLGFEGKGSDVRIAQYESEARVPKQELVNRMADILDINPHALTVPDIDTYVGLMHTFFTLEDIYGLKCSKANGKLCLCPEHSITTPHPQFDTLLYTWQQQTYRLRNGEISREEYDKWRYNFSEHDISQNYEKVSQNTYDDINTSFVETYYLIDFENVHEDGLAGSETLGIHDHVLLFSTKNAPKISIGQLTNFNSVDLSSLEIPAGKQSLDMHLVSYLGYLIGKNNNDKCEYIIISKDTDYDNIISFWKNHNILNIKRKDAISISQNKDQLKQSIDNSTNDTTETADISKTSDAANASDTSNVSVKADKAVKNNKIKVNPEMKTQLNNKIQQAIRKERYTQEVSNKVTSIVLTHYGEDKFAHKVHKELENHYINGNDLYKIVKPIIKQYSNKNSATDNINIISQPNNDINKILSQSGYKNDVATCVTSLVTKHHNDKNAKQVIYTAIVAKYGQAKGLNIYNHIKKKI